MTSPFPPSRTATDRGVAWSAIENWGRQALSFAVFWALARLLGTVEFGVIALASSFVMVLAILAQNGFAMAVVQREDLQPEHLNAAFWISVAGSVAGAAGLALGAPWIAGAFDEPLLAPVLRWLAPVVVIEGVMSVHVALLKRSLDFRALAIRTTTAVALGGVVGVALAVAGFGVWSLVAQQVVGTMGAFLVIWSHSAWRPDGVGSRAALADIFRFGRPIMAAGLINVVNTRGDIFIIGYVLGNTAVGAYAIAYRILTVLNELFTGSINKVMVPLMAPRQRDPEHIRATLHTATRLTMAITLPVFVGLACTAREVVPVVFGEHWSVSVATLQILCFLGVAQSLRAMLGSTLIAVARPDLFLRVTTLNAALNLVGFVAAVRFGIEAVAFSYTVAGFLVLPVVYRLVASVVPLDWRTWVSTFSSPGIAAAVMAAVVLGARAALLDEIGRAPTLAIVVVGGAATYGAALRVIEPSLLREIRGRVRQMLRPAPAGSPQ